MPGTIAQTLSGSPSTGCRTDSSIAAEVTAGTSQPKYDPLQEKAMEEMCILVDDSDRVVGAASKFDCHRVNPETDRVKLHRAFSVFLFNSAGDMLLQRRSGHKITFPGTFTNTCCSHPLYDIEEECVEHNQLGVRTAAQRRLCFELGIPTDQIRPEDFHYLTRIHYAQNDGEWGEHEIDYVLFLQKDVDLKPNPNEVSEIRFIKRSEIDDIVKELDAPLTPWFHLMYQHDLKRWWDNLHQLHEVEDHKTITRFE